MADGPISSGTVDDASYLKIWEVEQEYRRSRWTIVTFFSSVSFAIFGLSFQDHLASPAQLVLRLSGVIVYWFGYLLYLYHYNWTRFLRTYLRELERTGRTTFNIQRESDVAFHRDRGGKFGAGKLLLSFGLLYSGGIGVLWALGL
jgi:hypothetical protein